LERLATNPNNFSGRGGWTCDYKRVKVPLISGAKSRYPIFYIIVACRYNENLQRPPRLLVKSQ
jgi:hypothetical protein